MPREQKIGMTLLILGIGFAAAFCCRKPGVPDAALPGLSDEGRINREVAQLRTRPLLPGIDLESVPSHESAQADDPLAQELAQLRPLQRADSAARSTPPPIGTYASIQAPVVPEPMPERYTAPRETNAPAAVAPTFATQRSEAEPVTPRFHIVEPGETLSEIAWKYFGAASKYDLIYEANRDILPGPNLVRPNMKLRIPSLSEPDHSAPSQLPAIDSQPAPDVKQATSPEVPAVSMQDSPLKDTYGPRSSEPSDSSSVEILPIDDEPQTTQPASEQRRRLFLPAPHSPFRSPVNRIAGGRTNSGVYR